MWVREGLPLVKSYWLSLITSLSSVCLSTASSFLRGEADRLVGPRVLISTLFRDRYSSVLFPVTWDFTWLPWRAAWQLYQPTLGFWDVSLWDPWTLVCLGSMNLIFPYSGRDFVPSVPILLSISSRDVGREVAVGN